MADTQTAEEYFAVRRRLTKAKPMVFREAAYESGVDFGGSNTASIRQFQGAKAVKKWIRRNSEIDMVRVIGVVAVNAKGEVSEDMATDPDHKPWYLVDCVGAAGATFNVITDGDCWYPINRRSMKITTNRRPKKSVDLARISILDQQLIQEAIKSYVESF